MAIVSINGVNFSEWSPASSIEQWQQDASRVRRYLQLQKGDKTTKLQAAQAILGLSQTITSGGSIWISRSAEKGHGSALPDAHPWVNNSGSNYLWASSINNADNLGTWTTDGDNYPSYKMARFEVTYTTRNFRVLTDTQVTPTWGPLGPFGFPDEGAKLLEGFSSTRYITKYVHPGGKVATIRMGLMGPSGSTVPLPIPTPISIPAATIEYVWRQVPDTAVPWKAIAKQITTVNASEPGAPSSNFDGYAPGTLLFSSLDPQMGIDPFGNIVWEIAYRFSYLPNQLSTGTYGGHNSILWSSGGVVDFYTIQGMSGGTASGRYPFLSSNFSNLFRPDQ